MVPTAIEARVRRLCTAFPEVIEKVSHGGPPFFAQEQLVQLWPTGHHDHGFPHLWCAAPPGAQDRLARPRRAGSPDGGGRQAGKR